MAVLTTKYGRCVHNFAAKPCERHQACLRWCNDLLIRKGNEDEIRQVEQTVEDAKRARGPIADAVAAGKHGAIGFLNHVDDTIAGGEALLAVHRSPDYVDGEHVRPFAAGGAGRVPHDET